MIIGELSGRAGQKRQSNHQSKDAGKEGMIDGDWPGESSVQPTTIKDLVH